jgi:hypothetical protein
MPNDAAAMSIGPFGPPALSKPTDGLEGLALANSLPVGLGI